MRAQAIRFIAMSVLVAASCAQKGDSMDRQHAHIGTLGYDAPATWQHQDSTLRTSKTSVWTPPANAAKESVSVVRTEVHLPSADSGPGAIEKLLIQAQGNLRDAKLSAPEQIVSADGLRGVQLDIDFVPAHMTQRYHRVHAVFRDGETLVHVMYTAVAPDNTREAFRLVLNSLRYEEA